MEIVFDFDGTIVDTLGVAVDIINKLAPEYGHRTISNEDIELFKRVGSKKALKTFKISWLQFIRVSRRVIKELNNEIGKVKMFEGMEEVLLELKRQGFTLGMLSSDSKKNINDFLKKNNLEGVFDYVYLSGWMWGKKRKLNKIKKKRKLGDMDLIYVGDETKDVIACHKAKIRCIAVTWGYNSEEALKSYEPEWIAKKPKEIVHIIKKEASN